MEMRGWICKLTGNTAFLKAVRVPHTGQNQAVLLSALRMIL